jgi:hypothetical protein
MLLALRSQLLAFVLAPSSCLPVSLKSPASIADGSDVPACAGDPPPIFRGEVGHRKSAECGSPLRELFEPQKMRER